MGSITIRCANDDCPIHSETLGANERELIVEWNTRAPSPALLRESNFVAPESIEYKISDGTDGFWAGQQLQRLVGHTIWQAVQD
jgi:hypothetical protein